MPPYEAQLSPESSRASFTELLAEDLSEFFAAAASVSEDREQDASPEQQPPKAPTLQVCLHSVIMLCACTPTMATFENTCFWLLSLLALQALDMCRTYVAAFEAALSQDADIRTVLAAALSPTAVMEAFSGIRLESLLNVENAHVCLR